MVTREKIMEIEEPSKTIRAEKGLDNGIDNNGGLKMEEKKFGE